jgi:hypothetical protein
MMHSCNIPSNHLGGPDFKTFLEKYAKEKVVSRRTAWRKKNYFMDPRHTEMYQLGLFFLQKGLFNRMMQNFRFHAGLTIMFLKAQKLKWAI